MPRAPQKPTIEELDASIEAIRARAEKEIAALQQRKTRVQASHFQRITRVAKAAGCDLAHVSDADLIAALKALTLPFQGGPFHSGPFQGEAAHTPGTPQRAHENRETETAHGHRRSPKG
jgi:hypothetical protein